MQSPPSIQTTNLSPANHASTKRARTPPSTPPTSLAALQSAHKRLRLSEPTESPRTPSSDSEWANSLPNSQGTPTANAAPRASKKRVSWAAEDKLVSVRFIESRQAARKKQTSSPQVERWVPGKKKNAVTASVAWRRPAELPAELQRKDLADGKSELRKSEGERQAGILERVFSRLSMVPPSPIEPRESERGRADPESLKPVSFGGASDLSSEAAGLSAALSNITRQLNPSTAAAAAAAASGSSTSSQPVAPSLVSALMSNPSLLSSLLANGNSNANGNRNTPASAPMPMVPRHPPPQPQYQQRPPTAPHQLVNPAYPQNPAYRAYSYPQQQPVNAMTMPNMNAMPMASYQPQPQAYRSQPQPMSAPSWEQSRSRERELDRSRDRDRGRDRDRDRAPSRSSAPSGGYNRHGRPPTSSFSGKLSDVVPTNASNPLTGKRCAFFNARSGCKWGNECRFVHDRSYRPSEDEVEDARRASLYKKRQAEKQQGRF